jgi:cytochrome bd ubiquinol oxidase subunit I
VLPFFANQAGWIAAEVGRQPWIVYPTLSDEAREMLANQQPLPRLDHDNEQIVALRGLRTSEGLSAAVKAEQVLWSIIMFGGIYMLLFALWVFVLNSKIQHGPEEIGDPTARRERGEKFFDVAKEYTDPAGASMTETNESSTGNENSGEGES